MGEWMSKRQNVTLVATQTEAPRENQPSEVEYQVVHTTVGRCRIRIPRLAGDSEYARKLNWLVDSFDFVISVRINPTARSIIITYETSFVSSAAVQESLIKAIQQASVADIPLGTILTKTVSTIRWEHIGLPVFSLGLALVADLLALPIPALVIGGVIAVAALPFLSRAIANIVQHRQLDADLLDALWISLNTLKGDFVAPALMLSLIESGKALRDTTAREIEYQSLECSINSLERYVWVERSGQERRLPLKKVHAGERVVVYPGELIPVSGRVLRGTALIDEHQLTGESTLVCRSEGQVVHDSTLVVEGKLCVLTKRTGHNTRVGSTVRLIQAAPVHDTRVENHAGKVANTAIVPTLFLSAGIFALTGDTTRALAPLQLDFSNGIGIAVPTTILAALKYAAQNGVYIRSGRALEVLARTDTVVFDKTGTLTQGTAAVVAIQTAALDSDPLEVLALAASAEQDNTHPVAKAILRYAQENDVQTRKCEAWHYRIGMGIAARIDGQKILVGSHLLMYREGVDLDSFHSKYPHINSGSLSLVYIARDRELLGTLLYTDPLRPESSNTTAILRERGIDTYMLTGDRSSVADDIAYKLGIHPANTYAGCPPDKKIEFICELSNGKTVAFVGEGINDAAALAHADVSISFAGGSDLARETADVILLDDDLSGLIYAIDIAKQAMEVVYINMAIAVIPNIGAVLAGMIWALDPILELIISNVSALLAELNSFRPLYFEARTEPNIKTSSLNPANLQFLPQSRCRESRKELVAE